MRARSSTSLGSYAPDFHPEHSASGDVLFHGAPPDSGGAVRDNLRFIQSRYPYVVVRDWTGDREVVVTEPLGRNVPRPNSEYVILCENEQGFYPLYGQGRRLCDLPPCESQISLFPEESMCQLAA